MFGMSLVTSPFEFTMAFFEFINSKTNHGIWISITCTHVEDSSDSDSDSEDMDSDEKDAEYTRNMPDITIVRVLDNRFPEFEDLDDGVKWKRTKLLSERYGLTDLNLGYNTMMTDLLHPYIVLVKRLQTKGRPLLDSVRFWYSEFFQQMNATFMFDDCYVMYTILVHIQLLWGWYESSCGGVVEWYDTSSYTKPPVVAWYWLMLFLIDYWM